MSQFVADFRAKYPQYADVDDATLVRGLWRKYTVDTGVALEEQAFYSAIGFVPTEPVAQPAEGEPQVPLIERGAGPSFASTFDKPAPGSPFQTAQPQGSGVDMGRLLYGTGESVPQAQPQEPAPDYNWLRGMGERGGELIAGFARAAKVIAPLSMKGPKFAPAMDALAEKYSGLDLGYKEQATWDRVKAEFGENGILSTSPWAEVFAFGLEQGVKSIPDMAMVILNLPTYAAARTGEIAQTRAENDNREKADMVDLMVAAPFALGSAVLERIGAKGVTQAGAEAFGGELLKRGLAAALKRAGKGGLEALSKEAGTEAIQEGIIEYIGEQFGTEKGVAVAEALERGLAGAVAGGVFGGVAGTTTATGREVYRAYDTPERQIGRAFLDAARRMEPPPITPREGPQGAPTMGQMVTERLTPQTPDWFNTQAGMAHRKFRLDQYDLSPTEFLRLAQSVMWVESRGKPGAVSPKGATGRMQVMPGTAKDPGLGVTPATDMSDMELSRVGNEYLAALVAKYDGNLDLALAAYNAGMGRVAEYGGVPPFEETQGYIQDVLGRAGIPQQQPTAFDVPRDVPRAPPVSTGVQPGMPVTPPAGEQPTEQPEEEPEAPPPKPVEIAPTTQVLATYVDEENGMEARVARVDDGYTATLRDMESGEVLPTAYKFKTRLEADAKARQLANLLPAAEPTPAPPQEAPRAETLREDEGQLPEPGRQPTGVQAESRPRGELVEEEGRAPRGEVPPGQEAPAGFVISAIGEATEKAYPGQGGRVTAVVYREHGVAGGWKSERGFGDTPQEAVDDAVRRIGGIPPAETRQPAETATIPVEEPEKPETGEEGVRPELEEPSPPPLEGVPTEQVPGTGEDRETGERPGRGSRPDVQRPERPGGRGRAGARGVATGEGAVSVPARGGRGRGAAEQPGPRPDEGGTGTEQPGAAPTEPDQRRGPVSQPADERAGDYVLTAADDIGAGGPKVKFRNNVAAIEVLRDLEASGKPATTEQQAKLAKYVGWGGIPQAFFKEDGTTTKGWEKEAAQLKELLTPEEYAAARRSTQDAHYTSQPIVEAIWRAMARLGFRGGRVLEPSVGVGNFLGFMPPGLRSKSRIVGVELDKLTARIADNLYPSADIQNKGFQDFIVSDDYFDIAIGNPPFGSQKLYDSARRHLNNFSIHNYFFAKSLDTVRPGGVLAMVVSSRLMDKQGDKERRYIADRARLLGAIRLPNNAFAKTAGTEVTTDILFLQKLRPGEQADGESWMRVSQVTDAKGIEVPLNEYFQRNPDRMLGEWGAYGSMYGPDEPALVARPGQDTDALLEAEIARLPENVMEDVVREPEPEPIDVPTVAANLPQGAFFIEGGKVMVRGRDEAGRPTAAPAEFRTAKHEERARGMIALRDTFAMLRKAQLTEGVDDAALDALRKRLNKEYDAFVKKNGPINLNANKFVFRDDPTWPQLSALEQKFDKGITPNMAKKTGEKARAPTAEKSAVFTKRTQWPYVRPTSAGSAKDALSISLAERGKVDMRAMAELYGRTEKAIAEELGPLLYDDPVSGWVTADEYLSGNVKQKLALAEAAAKQDKKFERNVKALKEVIPADISAADIAVKPGGSWLPPEIVADFIEHLTGYPPGNVTYVPHKGTWSLRGISVTTSAGTKWGTDRKSVGEILKALLNEKRLIVRDRVDENTTRVNEAATEAVAEKMERIKEEFRSWIWRDQGRRERLVRLYNDTYNTDVLRNYDGSHLTLPGKVGYIEMRQHQADAIWRMLQQPTTLLDHVVGAGKTFTMIAGAMEMRRIGRMRKPLFVVPNHLIEQWATDFQVLYPGANVLAATKKDFTAENRKRLFARMAAGDWDAIIVSHSGFGRIDMSPEYQTEFIQEQIRELTASIEAMRESEGKGSRNVKAAEKQREALEGKIRKLADTGAKDVGLSFDDLGVDGLFVDEAHEFKNLGFTTSMEGLGIAGSNKAMSLFMKTRYLSDRTGGNIVFATGTPISNSMSEMYTIQRYLSWEQMKADGTAHFDAWAKNFGEIVVDWELSPTGKFRQKGRFSKFVNLPELMQRYLSFADYISNDDIKRQMAARGTTQPIPKVRGGGPRNVTVERSPQQAAYIGIEQPDGTYPEGSLIWRSENLPKKRTPEPGDDNMLAIMGDARKAALDFRLIDPSAPDYAGSKTNVAVGEIKRIYDQWNADKGTQLVFLDMGMPNSAKAREGKRIRDLIERAEAGDEKAQEELDGMSPDEFEALNAKFSVYDDIKDKLIASGIPENEIAYIHDANTEDQKAVLFGKVRSGLVRVLLGSTSKMGAGMNVQERLVALHHIDAPWRPSDLEQREGRIIRQGNALYERDPAEFEIEIVRYATKQTLDARMWQTIEYKARFIAQVRNGVTSDVREVEDIGGAASDAAEMKAASSGNPLILKEISLRKDIRTLENQKRNHEREQYEIESKIRAREQSIENYGPLVLRYGKDAKTAQAITKDTHPTIAGTVYDKPKEAGAAILLEAGKMAKEGKSTSQIGTFGGFKLTLNNISGSQFVLSIDGAAEHQAEIEAIGQQDPTGLWMRVRNIVGNIESRLSEIQGKIEYWKGEIPKMREQLGAWPKADDLIAKRIEHQRVIDELRPPPKDDTGAQQQAEAEAEQDDTLAYRADKPMPNWRPMYGQIGLPPRPPNDRLDVDGRTVDLPPEHDPVRADSIKLDVVGIIGPKVYFGKIKGKTRAGFYRRRNSEVRVKAWGNVEVLAHEMAHFLDFHYSQRKRFRNARSDKRFREEVKALSYTDNPKVVNSEGFAEFVRLWLTQVDEAAARAPLFKAEFERILTLDKPFERKMVRLQEKMHAYYRQGPLALQRAQIGKDLSWEEQFRAFTLTGPFSLWRQRTLDRVHGAQVVESRLHGEIRDASLSAAKQFQLINGAESVMESIVEDGTIGLLPDGSGYEKTGPGLKEIFAPVYKHGYKRFDLLMQYFAARRAQELAGQGREKLFTPQMIAAGLQLGVKYPEFAPVFAQWQEFNGRMLDFYEQMGLITTEERDAFAEANQNYVPFHRVIERLEDGRKGGATGVIGRRLFGGTQNVRDIGVNIVEGLQANVRAALIARAKATLYRDIATMPDGSDFAARLAPDARQVRVDNEQMAMKIANALVDLGLTISIDGMIIGQDPDNIIDVEDIADILAAKPELMRFWTFGHAPITAESFVDSAVIGGKRVYFESNSPLLTEMMTGMRGMRSGWIMRVLYGVKNFQTRTVTAAFQFLGPNLIRDTVSGSVISRNRFLPIMTSLNGMRHVIMNTPVYKEFKRQGGAFGTRIEARTAETRAARRLYLPSKSLWDTAAKALMGWDRFASAFEYGTRVGDFNLSLKAHKTLAEAVWEAREISTDFARMGNAELWAKFLRTVPFMNAGQQGLDKTYRLLVEHKGRFTPEGIAFLDKHKAMFLAKGGVVMAMATWLWLLNKDDERYQALTDDQKARFWWIFLPREVMEEPIKIPKPYDIGHIFATIPETAYEYIRSKDGDAAAETLAWTFGNMLGIGDYPGIMQPFVEVARNEKFTGAPVVPDYLMNVEPAYQFRDRTPLLYKKIGEHLGFSPLQAEHYVKGFLRYVEHYVVDATEAVLWKEDAWGERPFARGPRDYFTYQFIGQKVPYRTKWTEGYYELKKRAAGARDAMKMLKADAMRDPARLVRFAEDRVSQQLTVLDGMFRTIDKEFSGQQMQIAAIRYDKKLSASEKEKRIEDWYGAKNSLLGDVYKAADAALKSVEAELLKTAEQETSK